jgi:hypothetical protein
MQILSHTAVELGEQVRQTEIWFLLPSVNGLPLAAVALQRNRLAFSNAPGSRKVRSFERDPRVSITVTAGEQLFTMAQVCQLVRCPTSDVVAGPRSCGDGYGR